MLKKSVALLTICSLLAMSMVLVLRPAYAADPEIFVDPVSTTAVVGHEYIVYIKVLGVSDLYGWEFQLNYDKNKLDLTYAALATGGLNDTGGLNTFSSITDEATGHLWWAVSSIYPATGIDHTAAAAIFEIHFDAIAAGYSALDLSGAILSDSNGNAYALTTTNGSIAVYNIDLTVTKIQIDDLGCQLYKNDIDNDGNPYYYPVEVTVHNTGGLDAGAFHVKLEVYYKTGASLEAEQELAVDAGLAAGADIIVNFTTLFHPMNTKYYKLTATADSRNEVVEDNEANNQLVQDDIPVTVYGDVNGDHVVNILDGVVISKAWDAIRGTDAWYDIKADLSHNGVVDILDATRASLHWGETW